MIVISKTSTTKGPFSLGAIDERIIPYGKD